MRFPADPAPVAAPAVPDGPLSPRAAPAALSDVPAALEGLVAPGVRAVPVARVVPADLAARVVPAVAGLVARAAPRDPTTATRPLPRPRCGWPRRPGGAPPA